MCKFLNVQMSRFFYFFFAGILFWPGCGGSETSQKPSPRAERMAEAFCGCSVHLLSLNEQAAAMLQDSSRQPQLKALMLQIQAEYDKAKTCSQELHSHYGRLSSADSSSFRNALLVKCPLLVQQEDLMLEFLGE
jgi:hypothetical protein